MHGDLPLGLPNRDLTIDLYDVDLTRRQLRSVDTVHRAQGNAGELARRVLGVESPRTTPELMEVQFIGDLRRVRMRKEPNLFGDCLFTTIPQNEEIEGTGVV